MCGFQSQTERVRNFKQCLEGRVLLYAWEIGQQISGDSLTAVVESKLALVRRPDRAVQIANMDEGVNDPTSWYVCICDQALSSMLCRMGVASPKVPTQVHLSEAPLLSGDRQLTPCKRRPDG
jgi:hypothetical protein